MKVLTPPMYTSGGFANHHNGIHIADPGYRYPIEPPGYPGYVNMDIKMEPDPMMVDPYSHSMMQMPNAHSPPDANGQRMRKNKEDKICGVCGDRALGYNFDAISCESCKAFFRRNAPKGLEYFKCPYDEKCKMDISNRRFCKRCRLKKCFEIGMRKEYILSEEEKALKRQKIDQNSRKELPRKPNGSRAGCLQEYERTIRDLEKSGVIKPGMEVSSNTRPLAEEDQAAIDELNAAYDSSLEVSAERAPLPKGGPDSYLDLVNIAEISVRRVIDMSKKIKSFKSLPQADQIQLLKGGSIELLILRSVITFDKEKQHFLDPLDSPELSVNMEQMQKAEDGTGLFHDHMKFVKTISCDLHADKTCLILLLMVSLFSPDRGNLINKAQVFVEQERYSDLLMRYLESMFPYNVAHAIYPKLLMKLTDIRNLNEEHSQVLLKVNAEGLQPLMQEVLDMNPKQQRERRLSQSSSMSPPEAPGSNESF